MVSTEAGRSIDGRRCPFTYELTLVHCWIGLLMEARVNCTAVSAVNDA
jgi:hypothetical protein